MTEQNPNPDVTDDDAEGHMRHRAPARPGGVEGRDSMDDDVQGHARTPRLDIGEDEDDVEGHARTPRLDIGGEDEDDVEGHARPSR